MNHLQQLHPILLELVAKGVPITFTKDAIILPGFYKSGDLKLVKISDEPANAAFHAIDRYGKTTPIHHLGDLVELNFEWWETSRTRGNAGWTSPDPAWVQLLTEHGFIAAKETTIYAPRVSRNR